MLNKKFLFEFKKKKKILKFMDFLIHVQKNITVTIYL